MDCADRIAVLAAERTLEPVRALVQPGAPDSATVRARLSSRRVEVTIRRRAHAGPGRPAAYAWELREIEPDGAAAPGGLALASRASTVARDPEEAYWAALEAAQLVAESVPA